MGEPERSVSRPPSAGVDELHQRIAELEQLLSDRSKQLEDVSRRLGRIERRIERASASFGVRTVLDVRRRLYRLLK